MSPVLLVTGFGPFPRMPRNPSGALARLVAALPRWRAKRVVTRCKVLTTAYAAIEAELAPLLDERPDAVLMIGVAGRARHVRVETRGTGRRSMLFPDVAGERAPAGQRSSGQDRCTIAPTHAALRLLKARGIEARASRDAGRYLCNAAYFRALGDGAPVLFIHIPVRIRSSRPRGAGMRTGATPERRLADALVEIGGLMLVRSRQRRALP